MDSIPQDWPAAAATVRSISRAGRRQPRVCRIGRFLDEADQGSLHARLHVTS
jgi:hypothetical protein